MRKLTEVRKDLVQTIRQVVDVVSKYAGGALPEPARSRVRGFILKLPQRWASASKVPVATLPSGAGNVAGERETIAAASGTSAGLRARGQRRAAQRERGAGADKSGPPSRTQSPVRGGSVGANSGPTSPRIARATIGTEQGNVSAGTALVAAQRILTLATESLDMMRNVTGVVKESLDRADACVLTLVIFSRTDWSLVGWVVCGRSGFSGVRATELLTIWKIRALRFPRPIDTHVISVTTRRRQCSPTLEVKWS